MKVLIYGGGAVGSIFGWRIAQHSHAEISVVCRSNWQKVHDAGYHLRTTAWGAGHFVPHRVYKADSVVHIPTERHFDYIVCANKVTGDYSSTLKDLSSLVRPRTTLVAAQNGMDVEVPLRQAFPRSTVLTAICNIGCSQVSPGYVEQTAAIKRPAFLIGVHGHDARYRELDIAKRDALVTADPQFKSIDCAHHERWRKLIFNSAINSTTALSGLNTLQLLERPGAANLVVRLAYEAYRVGIASGVELDADMPNQTLELAQNSPPITPSTLQDARKRRPLELSPIFGYLVSQAAKVGTPIPYTTWIYGLLQRMNRTFVAEYASREAAWPPSALAEEPLTRFEFGPTIDDGRREYMVSYK